MLAHRSVRKSTSACCVERVPVMHRYSAETYVTRVTAGGYRDEVPCNGCGRYGGRAGRPCSTPRESVLPATSTMFAFALLCLGLSLTPGPNMMYLVSRSICQGRRAAM